MLFFRILVGAPTADAGQPGVFKGGAVYKCSATDPDDCQLIPFDKTGTSLVPFYSKNKPMQASPYMQMVGSFTHPILY